MFLYMFWAFFIGLVIMGLYLCWKISVTDLRRRIIPDAYLFPLLIIGLLIVTFFPWPISTTAAVVGMTCGYVMSATIGVIFDHVLAHKTPRPESPIGMGDIKLIAVGGLWLGPMGLAIALVWTCVFGMLWAYRKKQKFIPFAPFFIFGGILAWLAVAFLL